MELPTPTTGKLTGAEILCGAETLRGAEMLVASATS